MQKLSPIPPSLIELSVSRAGLVTTTEALSANLTKPRIGRLIEHGEITRKANGVLLLKEGGARCRDRVGKIQFGRLLAAHLGVMATGPTSAAAGQSALAIMGAAGLPATVKTEFTLKSGGSTCLDKRFSNRREPYRESYLINGIRVVSPTMALAQSVLSLHRNNAVSVMESLVRQKILDTNALTKSRELIARRPGAVAARPWFDLVDARSDSPAETFARLNCTSLGYPPDAIQLEVFNREGHFIARVDLAWRFPDKRWLLGEIDGFDYHSSPDDVRRDRVRQNKLVGRNTVLRRWSGADAMSDRLATDIHLLLKGEGWRPNQVPTAECNRLVLVE